MKQIAALAMKKQQKNQQGNSQKKQKHIGRNKTKWPYIFLLPSLLGVSIFVLIPFLDAVRRSFYEAMGGKFAGLSNYDTVLHNEAFLMAAKNTGRFLIVCIPLLMVISLVFTLLLNCLRKYGELFKTIFLIPMAIPAASIVLLWKVFFHESGLLSGLADKILGHPIDFMNTDKAFYVLVFSYIWKNIGYDMVLWIAGLAGISPALYEAAQIDGAGAFARLRYITIPNLMPTLFLTMVLSIVNSFKVFREAYLIAGDYPNDSIYMLQHLFNNWYRNLDVQKMCTAAVFLVAILFIVIAVLQRLNEKAEEKL